MRRRGTAAAQRLLVIAVTALSVIPEGVAAQRSVVTALDRLYRQYRAQEGNPDVRTLVLLDQELRRLMPEWVWEGRSADSTGVPTEYEVLGVRPAPFAPEFLSYSGKLLVEAHRLDQTSQREYTLYSTVFGADEAANSLPAPSAAEAYLQEFPAGPFALQAHLALAHFYADVFKVVQGEEVGRPRDYKYDCFQKYIDDTALAVQRTHAQVRAVSHYTVVTHLLPKVERLARELDAMRQGRSSGWNYCAD
jgi:hypothetical protein